jgi:hypothetical protein
MHPSPRVGAFRQWKINRADRVIGDDYEVLGLEVVLATFFEISLGHVMT